MSIKLRNIRVGYFDLQEKNFISGIVINDNFLRLLARYVKLITIPVNKKKNIKDAFSKLKEYKLDYIYIDAYNFLLESFLLRERFGWDIPFICKLHTVYPWNNQYIFLIPLIRKYDIIYAPSRYAKESFFRISDKFNVHLIPNFLDIDFIQNNISHNFKKDKKLITFMGRLVEEKGTGNKELVRDGKNEFLIDVNYDQDKKPKINASLTVILEKRLTLPYIRTFCQRPLLRQKGLCALQKECWGTEAGIWQ